ncbi:hypothetical protein [uncultured Methanobrevibacter sp.]|uniref:hypothetical protein n=1 Tax=uncultured Methanobrevibacter sp. TaxID=253161 RepID=UPI0025DED3DB|nr:hypothetical protein [uncultured Methanobrevibacter sp.]
MLITVSNVDLGNATNIVVIDELPIGLDVNDIGVISKPGYALVNGEKLVNGAKWNISKLNSNDVVELWITALVNVNKAGTLTNIVNVT